MTGRLRPAESAANVADHLVQFAADRCKDGCAHRGEEVVPFVESSSRPGEPPVVEESGAFDGAQPTGRIDYEHRANPDEIGVGEPIEFNEAGDGCVVARRDPSQGVAGLHDIRGCVTGFGREGVIRHSQLQPGAYIEAVGVGDAVGLR